MLLLGLLSIFVFLNHLAMLKYIITAICVIPFILGALAHIAFFIQYNSDDK